MLSKYFGFTERQTNFKIELVAGPDYGRLVYDEGD